MIRLRIRYEKRKKKRFGKIVPTEKNRSLWSFALFCMMIFLPVGCGRVPPEAEAGVAESVAAGIDAAENGATDIDAADGRATDTDISDVGSADIDTADTDTAEGRITDAETTDTEGARANNKDSFGKSHGKKDSAEMTPQGISGSQRASLEPAGLLTAAEERALQDEAVTAANRCRELYRDAEVKYSGTEYSYVENFSDEQRESVVKCFGEQGLVSVSDHVNMENCQQVEAFYEVCSSGGEGRVTVYHIYREGNISARTFICREGKMQLYYVLVGWLEGGIPEVRDCGAKELREVRLTEKGYFFYTYAETVMHGSLREYYRVKPLSDECRELTEKYVEGVSFVNYNAFSTNWDASNAKEILTPCMFEDIYRVCTGERLQTENGRIAAETYERVMTTCFPVSAEQVRECCGYDAGTDSYGYEMVCARQFPPFGEVVNYTRNRDGTITLYVEGVWPDYYSDCAFASRIVVAPFADGTFRYLSNSIEQRELELPGAAG